MIVQGLIQALVDIERGTGFSSFFSYWEENNVKVMVFIDFQNFSINMNEYYKQHTNYIQPKINYPKLAEEVFNGIKLKDNAILVKTFLFAYKPCDQLMKLDRYSTFYNWLNGLKKKPYFEIIEGRQEVRSINKNTKIDIKNPSTYTTEEKGTDINVAVHMLSKAYTNAYDIAILISGDSDYVPVVEQLHNIGKTVVLATLPQQNVSKYKTLYDQHIKIHNDILQKCGNNDQSEQTEVKKEKEKKDAKEHITVVDKKIIEQKTSINKSNVESVTTKTTVKETVVKSATTPQQEVAATTDHPSSDQD